MYNSRADVLGGALALALLAACGGGGTDPNDGGGGGGGGGAGTMSARINGVAWTANKKIKIEQGAGGVYTITGTNTDASPIQIELGLFNIGKTGTYPMGVGATVFGGLGFLAIGVQQWISPMDYSGTLVITEISASRIKGTFAFAALPVALGGATGLRNVTEGVFDLPLAGPYTPPGDHEGSSIVYDTSGVQAVVAATVIGSYHDTTLTFSAITSRAVILLSLKGVHGAGDYALSTTTPMKTLSFGVLGPPVASWGVDAADAGTVHITSLTATRIKGTLTATLQPGIGTVAAAPLVVTCTFDLGMAQLPAPH